VAEASGREVLMLIVNVLMGAVILALLLSMIADPPPAGR
jgi:hypothetical protein